MGKRFETRRQAKKYLEGISYQYGLSIYLIKRYKVRRYFVGSYCEWLNL